MGWRVWNAWVPEPQPGNFQLVADTSSGWWGNLSLTDRRLAGNYRIVLVCRSARPNPAGWICYGSPPDGFRDHKRSVEDIWWRKVGTRAASRDCTFKIALSLSSMRHTRPVQVKHLQIGGGAPVVIQSMTKTDTSDVGATVAQIEEMVRAGCEIVRLAVPDNDAAVALKEIRKRVPDVPIVADIHFHYKLALMALEAGIDKLRLNPGNIGAHERLRQVVRAAQSQRVPIRIGVNGGSL